MNLSLSIIHLHNVQSLEQLKWYFDGEKINNLNKLDFVSILNANENFNSQKVVDLFENYRLSINITDEIEDIDDVLNFMTNNNEWFNLIFQVK